MSFQQDLPTLVTTMQGKDTLSGWDCLISYSEDQINQLLAARASTLGILQPQAWKTPFQDPVTGDTVTMAVNMTMSSPTMQFIDSSASVTITCSITGSYQSVSPTTGAIIPFPENLQLVLSTSLLNVAGNFNGEWQPGSAKPDPANWIVVMEPGSSQTQGIVIDFTNLTAAVQNTPSGTTNGGNLAVINDLVAEFIVEYFETAAGLEYYIAGVNNGYSSDPGAQVLQPTSFCFTVVPGSTSATSSIPATLCMWIGLKGSSSSGQQQSGQTVLSFAPNSTQLTPLPTGNSASIIFSHSTMANLFLTPSLSKSFNNVQCTSTSGYSGMSFSLTWPSYQVNVPKINTNESSMDGCSFNMDTPATTLTINGNLACTTNDPVVISYISPVEKMSWSNTTWTVGPDGPLPDTHTGTVDATFSLGGTGQWSNDAESANELDLDFTIDQTLGCNPKAESKNWWQKLWGASDSVPPEYDSLHPEVPQVNLKLQMSYFLTTNLLFPGQNVFTADNPVAPNASSNHGLATPRDTILTGQVNPNPVASAIRDSNVMAATAQISAKPMSKTGLPSKELNIQPIPGSIDAFKADILAIPMTPMLGNLINTMSLNTPDVDQKVAALLASYGYGNLTADDYLSLVSMTSEDVLGASDVVMARTAENIKSVDAKPPPPSSRKDSGVGLPESTAGLRASPSALPFDLSMFGASYVVQQPAADAGKVLVINPVTTAISYMGSVTIPTQSTDPTTAVATVSWKVGQRTFNTVFKAFVNPSNVFTTSFSGTVTDSTGSQPFSGMMKLVDSDNQPAAKKESTSSDKKQPKAGRPATGAPTTPKTPSAAVIELDEFGLAVSIIGLIGVGLTCISLIGCLAPFWWRYNDNRNAERVEQLAAANHAYLVERFVDLEAAIGMQGQQVVNDVIQDHANDLVALQDPVNEQVARETQEQLQQLPDEELGLFKAENINDSPYNRIVDSAENIISVQVRQEIEQLAGPELNKSLSEWEAPGVLQPNNIAELHNKTIDDAVTNTVQPLFNAPVEGEQSFSESLVTSQVFERQSIVFQDQAQAQQKNLQDMQLSMSQTKQEEEETKEELTEAEQKAQDPNLTQEQREQNEAVAEKLQQDLASQENVEQQQQQQAVDLNNQLNETNEKQEEAEQNKESSETQANKAWETALSGE